MRLIIIVFFFAVWFTFFIISGASIFFFWYVYPYFSLILENFLLQRFLKLPCFIWRRGERANHALSYLFTYILLLFIKV